MVLILANGRYHCPSKNRINCINRSMLLIITVFASTARAETAVIVISIKLTNIPLAWKTTCLKSQKYNVPGFKLRLNIMGWKDMAVQ